MTAYSQDRAHDVNAVLYLGYVHGWNSTNKLHDRILFRAPGYTGIIDPNSPNEGGKYHNHRQFVDDLIASAISYIAGGNEDAGFLGELEQKIFAQGHDPEEYVAHILGCKHSLDYLRKNLPDNPTLLSEAIETALCVEVSLEPEFLESLGAPKLLRDFDALDDTQPLLKTRLILSAQLMQHMVIPATSDLNFELHYNKGPNPQEPEFVRYTYNTDNTSSPEDEEMEAKALVTLVSSFPNIRITAEMKRGPEGHICVDLIPKHGKRIELCELFTLADQLEQWRIDFFKKKTGEPPPPERPSSDGNFRWN